MTLEDYFAAPLIVEPLCKLDFCLETDGAVVVITTTMDRDANLRQPPVHVVAAAHRGWREWGRAFAGFSMPDPDFASSGHAPVVARLYAKAGVGPEDVDVALIYDHFTPMVVMQLEDYGFCARGEGGPFVESGAIRYEGGSIPVNTHGGQLSEAYIIGMTHVMEGVEQIRGDAIRQPGRWRRSARRWSPVARPRSPSAGSFSGRRHDGACDHHSSGVDPDHHRRLDRAVLGSRERGQLVAPQCHACGNFRCLAVLSRVSFAGHRVDAAVGPGVGVQLQRGARSARSARGSCSFRRCWSFPMRPAFIWCRTSSTWLPKTSRSGWRSTSRSSTSPTDGSCRSSDPHDPAAVDAQRLPVDPLARRARRSSSSAPARSVGGAIFLPGMVAAMAMRRGSSRPSDRKPASSSTSPGAMALTLMSAGRARGPGRP